MYVAKLKNASSQGGLFLQKVSKRSSTNEDKWGLCSKNSTHRCPLFRFAPPGTIIPSYPAFHDITCQAKLGSQIAIAAFHTSGALSVGAPLETFWNLKHANTPAKKTGWSCCTHWPSQNSKESIEESKQSPDCLDYTPTEIITWEIDGCSVMSLTVTECHGESTMGTFRRAIYHGTNSFGNGLVTAVHTGHLRDLQSPDSAELPQLNMNLQCTGCSFRSSLPRSTGEFY